MIVKYKMILNTPFIFILFDNKQLTVYFIYYNIINIIVYA